MKKSGIALLLTLSLTLCTVLGGFTFPVSAAEEGGSVATVVDYNAAVVGTELQVVINATNAERYKLYENGACVHESEYPIIVYAKYDATKAYGVSALDENGNETAITNIVDIAKPDKELYHASNILAGKPFLMADYAQSFKHDSSTVCDWNWMTDGNMDTRYSVNNSLNAAIDGIVELGGTYALGELRLYNFNGTTSHAGTNLVVEVYSDGKWIQVSHYDLADMKANLKGSGQKVGYISVDLFGYNGEAVRILNDGMTNTSDCLSYWEFTLSGVLISSYSDYLYRQQVEGAYEKSDNLFAGLAFTKSAASNITWESGTKNPASMTDGVYSNNAPYKGNGTRIEFELDFDSDYVIIDEFTVTYLQNTGAAPGLIGYNSHYVSGQDVVISVYFAGVWRDVYTETFTDNLGVRTFKLGGVPAEKIRYYVPTAKTTYYYDQAEVYTGEDGKKYPVLDENGNPVVKEYNVAAVEGGIGIVEMTATGAEFTRPTDLTEKDNVFLGHTFTTTDALLKNGFYAGALADLTDGDASDRCVPNGNVAVDVTLDFGGVASLNELTIVYESVARSGVDILIEVIYDGKTYVMVDEDYLTGYSTRIFDLRGILAESVRIYITKGRNETGGSCIGIREISCTGSVGALHDKEEHNNILAGQTMTKGPAGTSVHADAYDYHTLTDASMHSSTGRFSTITAKNVVMDANATLDEKLDLGELRIYDFEPNTNSRVGNHLQIMLLVRGSWRTVYDLYGDDIYSHRPTENTNYLSFDMGGINATAIRIIARQTEEAISVTIYEIELSASWVGYADEQAEMEELKKEAVEKEYDGSNVLLGIPSENVSINWHSINPNHPISLAFDGIIEPDVVNGIGSKNRYATGGIPNPIKDANGNTIGATHTLTIDLKNDTQLNVLSVYEWRSGTAITRSNKTSVEVKVNGTWVKMFSDVSLSNDKNVDRTDFDLGGVVASAIRITFLNDYFAGDSSTGEWPTPTIKEITCTGTLSVGDLFDAFESIDLSTDSTPVFGLEQVKDQKLEELKAQLVAISGASSEEIIAKINEFKQIAAEFESGATPVTDAYGDFKSANISLAGNVGFNFYGSLDENVEELFPNATVVVRYNSVLDGVATDNTEQRQLSELKKDGNGRYIVDFELAAAQMTDTVEIRLVLDGNNCGEHITWSIKDYCDKLVSETADEGLKSVVNAMLTYGAYAQTYFGYNTDKLAADASGELESVTETAKPAVNGSATGVSMSSWTLALDSNVTAKLYVRLDGVAAEDIGVTITTPSGEVINVDSLEAVGSRYRISVTDITSGFLNDIYTVTITNKADGSVMTVESSAMCYVSAVLAMENADPALVNLVTALKLYSNAADSYFGK